MGLTARQKSILERVQAEGRVWVADLSGRFSATPQTIRKDLEALAQAHQVVRFHGGAALLAGVEYTGFEARRGVAAADQRPRHRRVARHLCICRIRVGPRPGG